MISTHGTYVVQFPSFRRAYIKCANYSNKIQILFIFIFRCYYCQLTRLADSLQQPSSICYCTYIHMYIILKKINNLGSKCEYINNSSSGGLLKVECSVIVVVGTTSHSHILSNFNQIFSSDLQIMNLFMIFLITIQNILVCNMEISLVKFYLQKNIYTILNFH